MARLGFALATLASLGMLGCFFAVQSESPGLSFAAALIGLPLLVAGFGFSKCKDRGITKDGKGAGWAAAVIAVIGLGYLAMFFSSWLPIAGVWVGLQIPMIVGVVTSPTVDG